MLKKMMLLAMSVGALVAFAVPATASAETDVWTHYNPLTEKHETLIGSASQAFEGKLKFTTPAPPLPIESSFECQVTVKIQAQAPSGGKVTVFAPTTEECEGTGIFTNCVLKEHFSNIEVEEEEVFVKNWNIDVSGTPGTVKANSGNLTIRNVYKECANATVTGSHLEFPSVSVEPTVDGKGTITALSISGTATNGFTKASGTVTPENGTTLGLETVKK